MSEGFVDINSLEVSEKDIINIKGGLIGMPELKRFILMEFDEDSPLHWLQSLDDSRIGFVVSDPSLFSDNYTVTLDKRVQEVLEIGKDDDLVVMVVVTVKGEAQEITGNLLGPIVVNATKRIGCQVVLESSEYSTTVPLKKMVDASDKVQKTMVEIMV